MIYTLVFLLQLAALFCYLAIFMGVGAAYFQYGTGLYLLSIILFFVGILRSNRATPLNCFTVLLFLLNMLFLTLFLFGGYLGAFMGGNR